MTVATELIIFDLLPGVDLLDRDSLAAQHFQTVLSILTQQKGFLRHFWVRCFSEKVIIGLMLTGSKRRRCNETRHIRR
jgi:hypothetical protein